jgi:hypothetical protein
VTVDSVELSGPIFDEEADRFSASPIAETAFDYLGWKRASEAVGIPTENCQRLIPG